ncbi:MAG: VWA domain-containing protein [Deltaproteobacteria bacterium]|nr:VWA domain-containing protein [Deltaproteobacteria bacterium]
MTNLNVVRTTLLFAAATLAMTLGFSGTALADASVSWLSPPDGTSFPVGTIVNPVGQAGAGNTGGTGLDLALVIDVSGSMGSNPGLPGQTRLQTAQTAAIALVNALPQNTTSVTVITFSHAAGTALTLTALNPNKASVIAAINSLSASGGTDIGSGINQATSEFQANADVTRSHMMVVLSDGISGGNPNAAATAAALAGIQVHSVAMPGAHIGQMQQIASNGGGTFNDATDLTTLTGLFDGTGGNLVGIDHVEIELPDGTVITVPVDGLGNFVVPDWVMELGPNEFIATAFATDGTQASDMLTLIGTDSGNIVPEPSAALLFCAGGLLFQQRMRRQRA